MRSYFVSLKKEFDNGGGIASKTELVKAIFQCENNFTDKLNDFRLTVVKQPTSFLTSLRIKFMSARPSVNVIE